MTSLIAFHILSDRPQLVKMQKDRRVFGAICPNKMGQQCIRLRAANKKGKVMMPRSSSPITEYVDKMPCIVEQAFATIAWDDLDDCASVMRRESDSLDSQVNDSDGDDQDFGEYALDFIADSPATLESSLSPTGLVPFQGCIIPPLTPHPDISSEHSLNNPPVADKPHVQDATLWKDLAQHQGRMLEGTMETNNQLREAVCRRKQEINSLQERNVHLRELASRAKDLASVLDKLMRTVKEPYVTEPVLPSSDTCNSTSPCKRQRLDEECESVTSGCSVEDILRDISTRCNAVLQGPRPQQECDSIRMYGAFSGLQTSISKGNSVSAVGAEAGEHASFRTSIREHCTIRTQGFPQGHAFTSRTQHGGYRFRWVPNHS